MTETQKMIVRAESMIQHFEKREEYHDGKVDELQIKIDALNAEKDGESDKADKIRNDYLNKDNDE